MPREREKIVSLATTLSIEALTRLKSSSMFLCIYQNLMELSISTVEDDQRPVRYGCGSPFLSIILLWIIKSPRKQDSEGFLSFLNPILLNLKM